MNWEIEPVDTGSRLARAFSPTNIAVAKYWGKRDPELNLPTNGSISITLAGYGSFTTVEFSPDFKYDRLILNGKEEARERMAKVGFVLDAIRALSGTGMRARIQSMNNFPTAAGLASSASGLSAVTFAAAQALGLQLETSKLSEIARRGSGSACRSFFGGFVEWRRGEKADGTDSIADQIAEVDHWPLDAVIAIVNKSEKGFASTGGMETTRSTSPYFDAWVDAAQASLAPMRFAIQRRDFATLAELAEVNCIRMHASAMAAQPPIVYWHGATLDVMMRVKELRKQGVPAFFTIDAGPNVVIFCERGVAQAVQKEISAMAGVQQVLRSTVGRGTRLFDAREFTEEP